MHFDLVAALIGKIITYWAVSPLVHAVMRLLFFCNILALVLGLLFDLGYPLHYQF
jgi:hypothetical protein